MRPDAVQYLLDVLPKLQKLFSSRESEPISFETTVLLAILVDQCQTMTEEIKRLNQSLSEDLELIHGRLGNS